MMKIIKSLIISLMVFLLSAVHAQALPTIDQTGNLLANGDFESGTMTSVYGTGPSAFTSWSQWQQPSNVSANLSLITQQVTNPLIEGNYTAYISGNHDDGLFQYDGWGAGTYTLSGWVYVASGAAHLGIGWDNGHQAAYSPSSSILNQWIFLQVTATVPSSLDGPVVYGVVNSTDFYAEGIWFNTGSVNNSPFQPDQFNPNAVPEPTTMILYGVGFVSAGLYRRMRKS